MSDPTPTADAGTTLLPGTISKTEPKPGYKTTEFYLALAAKLLGAAFTAGLIGDGSTLARLAGLAAVVLTSLGYSVSRGMVKAAAMLLLIVGLSHGAMACGPSAQQKAIATTLAAVQAADKGFLAYDTQHQQDLVIHAGNRTAADAALATWTAEETKVTALFKAAYGALAAAAVVQSQPNMNGMMQAAVLLYAELKTLGVP